MTECCCTDQVTTERPRIRPLKALRHFRKLIENKEDTEQVFHIIQSLNGNSLAGEFEKFKATEKGQARLSEKRYLPPLLDNHDWLATLPSNTVGAAYLHFMQSQGLTAQGLVDEFDKFAGGVVHNDWDDDLWWFANRMRDTHDLFHVLTGYSRDALGEACVLAFSYSQDKSRGALFIAYMAGLEVRKSAPSGAPVLRAVREGQKRGKACSFIPEEDILVLLEENLDAARKRLGIYPERYYSAVHDRFHSAGINPFDAVAPAA